MISTRSPRHLLVKLGPLFGLLALLVAPSFAPAAPAPPSASSRVGPPGDVHPAGAVEADENAAPLGVAAQQALRYGYLVPDLYPFERDRSGGNSAQGGGGAAAASLAPTLPRNWTGIRDTQYGPSDSTSAVGTTRYIELVNSRFAIYSKTSNTALATGTLNSLAGRPSTDSVFDPQTIWDPGTSRFYYMMDDVVSATQNQLAFGWSKTATPNSAADFCKYVFNYGSEFPDYPKLGDSQDFIFAGVNTFDDVGAYVGSDVFWAGKPAAGSTCPTAASVKTGAQLNLAARRLVFTPVGVNQIDTSATGHVLAVPYKIGYGLAVNQIHVFTVTKSGTGNAVIGAAKNVPVASYEFPEAANQPNGVDLDALDGRLTQAVSAVDPAHSNQVGIWTQHTVWNGSFDPGSEVRWYEINYGSGTLLQSGERSSTTLDTFNGAISPNRAVNGSTKSGGGSMVLSFNNSSSSANPAIRVVSKIGTGAQSAPLLVKNSSFALDDFTCGFVCRWGDYAGASPDPAPPTGTTRVWGVSQFVAATGSSSASGWGTQNFAVVP